MAILETKNLTYTYGVGTPFEKTAVENVNLSVEKGAFVGVIGHTGSGKSTLIQMLNGLIRPTSGQVLLNGEDIWTKPKEIRRVRFQVGMVFQYPEYQLFEETCYKDIAFGPKNMGLDEAEVDRRVHEAADFVGLDPALLERSPFELSGGMRQRVMIAMAMVCKPKLLIADEPTTALDVTIEAQILRLMKELRDETGMSVLIITHNMGVVAEICDYVYVMYAGKIMEQAETFELFDHTMHPYTKGLLDSIPRIGQNAERLHTIPGVVPNLLHLSQGCPFSNRCEYATDQCRTEKAQLHPVAPDHQVRCFRCEEEHQ